MGTQNSAEVVVRKNDVLQVIDQLEEILKRIGYSAAEVSQDNQTLSMNWRAVSGTAFFQAGLTVEEDYQAVLRDFRALILNLDKGTDLFVEQDQTQSGEIEAGKGGQQ